MGKEKVYIQWTDDSGAIQQRSEQGELVSLPQLDGPGVSAKMLINGYDTPVTVEKLGKERVWVHTA